MSTRLIAAFAVASTHAMIARAQVDWSTYLGGNAGAHISAMKVVPDGSGDVIVAGNTYSTDFPGAAGSIIRPTYKLFVTRLAADGRIVRWTRTFGGLSGTFGRQFIWRGLDVDAAGNIVVAGDNELPDFPTSRTAYACTVRGNLDAFVTRLDPGGEIVASTLIGGFDFDSAIAVAFDAASNVVVFGETASSDFPTTAGCFDPTYNPQAAPGQGVLDWFLVRFDPTLATLQYGTFIGSQGLDFAGDMTLDAAGAAIMIGSNFGTSGAQFPTTTNGFDRTWNGSGDVIMAKVAMNGGGVADLQYGTFLGGAGDDRGLAIAVDPTDSSIVYLAGGSYSIAFPTTGGVIRPTTNATSDNTLRDGFLSKFRLTATPQLLASTYLGGTFEDFAVDVQVTSLGEPIVAGFTRSHEFPTTVGAINRTWSNDGLGISNDVFIMRLSNTLTINRYCTLWGGAAEELVSGGSLAISPVDDDTLVVAGDTRSSDMPVTADVIDGDFIDENRKPFTLHTDGYVARIGVAAQTGDTASAAPIQVAPANNAIFNGDGFVRLDWSDVIDPSGIEAYEFHLSRRADFNPNFLNYRGSVAASEVIVPPIGSGEGGLALGNWFWRVRTSDNAGNLSAWSPTFTFNTNFNQPAGLPVVSSLNPASANPAGAGVLDVTVTLTAAAPPGGSVVHLSTTEPLAVTVPQTITIPAGQSTGVAQITLLEVWNNVPATIAAISGLGDKTLVTLRPDADHARPFQLAVSPLSVPAGQAATATITLSAAAPPLGTEVFLYSGDADLLTVPRSVIVPGGETRVDVPLQTHYTRRSMNLPFSAERGTEFLINTLAVVGAADCVGDVDGDGSVGLSDLAILLAQFGTSGASDCNEADTDGDGEIELSDLAQLLGRFGAACE